MKILSMLSVFIDTMMVNLGVYGPILGCALIIVESVVPILPLCVFITMLFVSYGYILGFIISWVFTIIGCNLSYFLCKKVFQKHFRKMIKEEGKASHFMKRIQHLSFKELSLIVAIPFTPAFLVNIACGLSNMPYKKFFYSMVIGKLFMVYFWGFIGTTFIECLKTPIHFIYIIIMLLIAYIISHIVNKKLKLD